ncbi:MAG TPA: DNA polymerase III subunit gamma/tau [Candidatus Binataceae bacterium]|nr:DNA polymerase III subunit gamma/tau [Candidatus Binataceae bacterium]
MAASPASHLVLARKWRPERFSELVGQEHVTRTLTAALERGRIAHAFLFTGIRGVGKTTAARILARCLNCEKGPTAEPCGECAACVEIRAGRALDVSEIDGATYRKIDDARAIIENLSYRPARDRFKIYIIDEAHQLTDQAFNALLKTLEEPPPHVKFILATTEPQKMPETILSRLQRYDFRRIPYTTILERMKELASRENAEAEEAALRVLAREAGGSMRDAERMLETAIASGTDGKVIESEVAASLGVASRSTVFKIADAIVDKNAAAALRQVRELAARGANLESLGRDLLETLRNLAVAKLPADGSQSPLDDIPDHEVTELKRIAAKLSSRDVMRLFRLLADTQEQVIKSPYPDLLLEMAVVRMASLAPVVDADELMRMLEKGAPTSSGGTPSSSGGSRPLSMPAAPPPPAGTRKLRVEGEVKADAPLRPAPQAPPPPPVTSGERELPELRDFIRSKRAALAGFMEQGAALALSPEGDLLTVTPRNDIYVRYLNDNKAVIAELATEHYARPMRVELAQFNPAAPVRPAPPSSTSAPANAAASAPATAAPSRPAPEPEPEERTLKLTIDPVPPPANPGAPRRSATPEERTALLAEPTMRRIVDTLEARLVEVRIPAPGTKEES